MRRTWDDLRAAVRYLTRRPGSALVLTVVLALFIGAATAAFGLARAVLWRPLPFADAERLMFVWESVERDGTPQHSRVTGARYAMWRDTAATAFSRMSPFGAAEFTLETPSGENDRVSLVEECDRCPSSDSRTGARNQRDFRS